ncbi:tubulin-specific chaperone cofactor E-like protein [Tubulanus polymorphus]|uniref:tubulin-specific chaperone cofactor E-like protein n=1 Tax=Tubulanus polymorphus TaxID=672921 RepID=UPI003DA36389
MTSTLVKEIHDKYADDAADQSIDVSWKILAPKKPVAAGSGNLRLPPLVSLASRRIKSAAENLEDLRKFSQSITELDLSNNEISSWEEVMKILECLTSLKHLNLSFNPLSSVLNADHCKHPYPQLTHLVLNGCQASWDTLFIVLDTLPKLKELHLSLNSYDCVKLPMTQTNNDAKTFRTYDTVETLHMNKTDITKWCEIGKLGNMFPKLQNLVVTENKLEDFSIDELGTNADTFPNLKTLSVSNTLVSNWEAVQELASFPNLTEIRLQGIPLLQDYNEKQRRMFVLARLPAITRLNGSSVKDLEREDAERAFLRHYMNKAEKPARFDELEMKHGKLNALVEVDLSSHKQTTVQIKFENKVKVFRVDLNWTLSEFKERLKGFTDLPPRKFTVSHFSGDAPIYLHMDHATGRSRRLHSYRVDDGDIFVLTRKA